MVGQLDDGSPRRRGLCAPQAIGVRLRRPHRSRFNTFWRTRQHKGFEPFYFVTRRGLKSAAAFHKVTLTKQEEDQLVAEWKKLDPYPT